MQRRVVIPYQHFRTTFFEFFCLKYGTDMLSRNVSNKLPIDTALYPSRQQITKVGYSGSEGCIFSHFFIHLFVYNSCVTKPSLFFRGQNGTDCRLSVVCSLFIVISEVQYDTFWRETIAEVRQWHSLVNIPQQLTEAIGERNVCTRKNQ
jgi:hypothetical protein